VGANNSVLGFAASAYAGNNYVEGYAIINGALTGAGGAADQDRYRATLTHEIGHFLGLGHSQVAMHADYATMYPLVVNSGQQNLTADDIAAISNLYPIVGYAATVGSISGTVRHPTSGILSGVNVIAMNSITGQSYSTVVDYFSGGKSGFDNAPPAAGTYTISGLPPGSYYVRIEPVNANFTGGSSVASYNTPRNTSITHEWYNGGNESGDMLLDDINQHTAVVVAPAVTTTGIDFIENESATISSLTYHDGTPLYAFSIPQGAISRYAVRCTAPVNGSLVAVKLRVGSSSTLPLNGTLTVTVHQNAPGSLAGVPGAVLGSVVIPFSELAADQNNEIWLRGIGAPINFNSGDNFHISFSTNGVGSLTLFSDDGSPTENRTSYYTGSWRNFPEGGYQAGYNLIVSAVYSSSAVGNPVPSVRLAPASLDFGRVRPGAGVSKSVTLSNTGTGTLNVTGVSIAGRDSSDYTVVSGGGAFTLVAGASRDITVRFAPARAGGIEDGSKSARLVIASNAATSPDNTPLLGHAVEPVMTGIDTAGSFGQRLVGGTYTLDAAVGRNTGTDTLHINSIALVGGDAGGALRLLSGTGPMILPPDSTLRVRLQFTPTARRSYSATLQISHDAQGSPKLITVSGQGIAPVMNLTASSLNAGKVRVGQTGPSRTLYVRNDGDAPLRVISITTSGLNGSEFVVVSPQASAAAPRIVQAGDSLAIAVQFRPTAAGGRTATLDISPEGLPVSHVDLIGIGLQSTCICPPEIVDFGDVALGSSEERLVRLNNVGNDTATLLGIEVLGNGFTLVDAPAAGTRVLPDSSITVRIRYTPGSAATETGELRISNDGSIAVATARLLGRGVSSGIAINRNLLAFGLVPRGGMRIDTFVVRNSGTLDLTVASMTLGGGDASAFEIVTPAAPFTVPPGGSRTVMVRLRPQSSDRSLSAVLSVRAGDGTERTLGLTATIGEALVVSVPTVDFGSRVERGSYDTSIVVRNVGPTDILVSSIAATGERDGIPGSYFQTLTFPPMVIGANDSAEVRVRFTPGTGEGSYRGSLMLMSDGENGNTVEIALAGSSSLAPVAGIEGDAMAVGGLSIALLPVHPNPMRDGAEVAYSVRGVGHLPMSMALADERGAIVALLRDGEIRGDGAERIETLRLSTAWLPSGRYFLLLRAGARSVSTLITVVR
jgi:hypothetical protein